MLTVSKWKREKINWKNVQNIGTLLFPLNCSAEKVERDKAARDKKRNKISIRRTHFVTSFKCIFCSELVHDPVEVCAMMHVGCRLCHLDAIMTEPRQKCKECTRDIVLYPDEDMAQMARAEFNYIINTDFAGRLKVNEMLSAPYTHIH
jgi:hypothetical protein